MIRIFKGLKYKMTKEQIIGLMQELEIGKKENIDVVYNTLEIILKYKSTPEDTIKGWLIQRKNKKNKRREQNDTT